MERRVDRHFRSVTEPLPVLPLRAFQASLGHVAQVFISVSSFCLSGGNAVVSGAGEVLLFSHSKAQEPPMSYK